MLQVMLTFFFRWTFRGSKMTETLVYWYFSTVQNMDCLCDVDELFIDGTFKCCPRYFFQLYSILDLLIISNAMSFFLNFYENF